MLEILTPYALDVRQNPLYAFINIFSILAIGLAPRHLFIYCTNWAKFWFLHTKSQAIYRLDEVQNFPGTNEQKVALSMPGIHTAIIKRISWSK